jgi:uncharacterized membrane protein YhiD involved in acid resistance
MRFRRRLPLVRRALLAAALVCAAPPHVLAARAARLQPELQSQAQPAAPVRETGRAETYHEITEALLRLPLAAVLGAALALRPQRRGTPPRTPAVVQTQIVLAVVGAVVMLVVGASLARAFGIVGAANLVRYRSKIDDPKDAAVMLCALSVGLAAGVGLYALSIFSTVFMVVALWIIESFEPHSSKRFLLRVKAGENTDQSRDRFEKILRMYRVSFELRTASDDEVCYDVSVPIEVQTDDVSNRILALDQDGHMSVDWEEKKNRK